MLVIPAQAGLSTAELVIEHFALSGAKRSSRPSGEPVTFWHCPKSNQKG
jgi:hypothetical protein